MPRSEADHWNVALLAPCLDVQGVFGLIRIDFADVQRSWNRLLNNDNVSNDNCPSNGFPPGGLDICTRAPLRARMFLMVDSVALSE